MSITKGLSTIKKTLPDGVTLVAVSKTKPIADVQEAYDAGQRIFGENKIQEMSEKKALLPKDIQWHMIGHVQTNKVRQMAEYISLVHGVDSLKLLEEIDKQAAKHNRVINCLLQMHIAEEETKFGLDKSELMALLASEKLTTLDHICIKGLMGMATFTEDKIQIEKEFKHLKSIFDTAKSFATSNCEMTILSMGMSGDYELAIACGSNMVRIGSSIFGTR